MHAPISASVAGVVGMSNTREARLNATGAGPQASSLNRATNPLEENTDIGDRDAQEQYLRSGEQDQSNQQSDSHRQPEQNSDLLNLPAEDEGESQALDMLG